MGRIIIWSNHEDGTTLRGFLSLISQEGHNPAPERHFRNSFPDHLSCLTLQHYGSDASVQRLDGCRCNSHIVASEAQTYLEPATERLVSQMTWQAVPSRVCAGIDELVPSPELKLLSSCIVISHRRSAVSGPGSLTG